MTQAAKNHKKYAQSDGQAKNDALSKGQAKNDTLKFIASNGLYNVASSLCSAHTVLPFIYTLLSGPAFFAGMLIPALMTGRMGIQFPATSYIKKQEQTKLFLAIRGLGMAACLGILVATILYSQRVWVLVFVFMVIALSMGILQGFGSIANGQLRIKVVAQERRKTLNLEITILASFLLILFMLWTHFFLKTDSALQNHMFFLWAAMVLYLVYSPLVFLVGRKTPQIKNHAKKTTRLTVRQIKDFLNNNPWYFTYTILGIAVLTIALAIPFYIIHATLLHGHEAKSLGILLLGNAVGQLLGAVVWRQAFKKHSATISFYMGLTLAVATEIFVVVFIGNDPKVHIAFYTTVCGLLQFTSSGITQGLFIFKDKRVTKQDSSLAMALSNSINTCAGIALAALYGYLAHMHNILTALTGVVVLSIVAFLTVITALHYHKRKETMAVSYRKRKEKIPAPRS